MLNGHTGWIVLLHHGSRTAALPATLEVIDKLTLTEQTGLPTLCGVWASAEDAQEVVDGLSDDFKPLAEILRVHVTVVGK